MISVTPKKLYELLHDKNLDEVLVDVREPDEFKHLSIPGSKNVPLDEVRDAAEKLRKYGTVYVTCGSGVRSQQACMALEGMGINVVNVDGGLTAWQREGLVTKGKGLKLPIIRQVMIAAGSLTIISVLGALFVSTWWVFLSLAVGCGLLFAGLSGYCFMAWLLAKMPWNR